MIHYTIFSCNTGLRPNYHKLEKNKSRTDKGAFCQFPSSRFITAIVVNPPEKKLAKRTSEERCAMSNDQKMYLQFYQTNENNDCAMCIALLRQKILKNKITKNRNQKKYIPSLSEDFHTVSLNLLSKARHVFESTISSFTLGMDILIFHTGQLSCHLFSDK